MAYLRRECTSQRNMDKREINGRSLGGEATTAGKPGW